MATNIILKNNARSTLLAGITSGATNLSVQSGHGARFSAPVTGEIAKLTLYDTAGNIEICHGITRSGDGWSSILRAQEGTTARAWNAGDGISENATAGFLGELSQLDRNETITGNKTFTGPQVISSTAPTFVFVETDAAADNGRWDFVVDGEAWRLRATNDAGNSATNIIIVQRTGNTIDSVTIGGTTVSVSGTLSVSGGQIIFPATQNASANPNTLDDYEEGTWTPELRFGGGTTGITYSNRSGYYTKIGRMVFFGGRFLLTNKGSSTGSAVIGGLPFAVGLTQLYSVSIGHYTVNVTYSGQLIAGMASSTQVIDLYQLSEAGVETPINDTNFVNTSELTVSGHYHVG